MKPENKGIRPEKKSIATELDQRVAGALYMILADYTGMDMPQTLELKSGLREKEAYFNVVNNRLLGRILGDDATPLLKGQTAMIYGAGDVAELAKLPSKDALRAMLLGTLMAPCSNLVGVLDQKVASLVYVLDAARREKEEA